MMSQPKEILLQLDLQKKRHSSGNLIAIIEHKNSHGNFILSTILDYNLKNNDGVCFVGLYNPVSHYHHVGAKLGYNLKAGVDKNQVHFIDMLSMSRESLFQNSSMKLGNTLVMYLFETIKDSIVRLIQQHKTSYIFIDDISILLSLGAELKDIQAFLHYLQILAEKSTESSEKQCCIVVLSHVDAEDDEGVRLGAVLTHAAVTHVNVTDSRCTVTHS